MILVEKLKDGGEKHYHGTPEGKPTRGKNFALRTGPEEKPGRLLKTSRVISCNYRNDCWYFSAGDGKRYELRAETPKKKRKEPAPKPAEPTEAEAKRAADKARFKGEAEYQKEAHEAAAEERAIAFPDGTFGPDPKPEEDEEELEYDPEAPSI